MAGLELAEAFVELRVRATEVKKDVEKGLTEADSESAGKTTGQRFAAGFKGVIGELGKIGVATFGAAAVYAVKAGGDLETSQIKLETAIKNTGQSAEELASPLDSARKRMEALGYTNAQTNTSLAAMTLATGDTKTAIGLLGTAADLAAAKGIDLKSATQLVDQAAGGANRALKQLNVTVASGTDWAKATAAAQGILKDQINQAGGAAGFARQHHLELADAQELIRKAAEGSIPALNRLGLDVLPKTATAAQRAAEFQRIMNQRIGGEAAKAAETADGQFKVLAARFTDMAAAIGVKVMPALLALLGWFNRTGVIVPAVIALFGLLGAAMLANATIAVISFARMTASAVAWAAAQSASIIETIALWVLYTGVVESSAAATIIATGGIILILAALAIAAYELYRHWSAVWKFCTDVLRTFRHDVAVIFDAVRHYIAASWDQIYSDTIGRIIRIQAGITAWDLRMRHDIAAAYDDIRHDIAAAWDSIWNNTIGRIQRGVHDVEAWFHSLPGRVTAALGDLGRLLLSQGGNLIDGLWNGIKNEWTTVEGWFKGLPSKILHALGIASPPPWAIDAGKHIMGGLLKGIAHGAANVKGYFTGLASDILGPLKKIWTTIFGAGVGGKGAGAGVQQWRDVVRAALTSLGLPLGYENLVLDQMQSESGGNASIVNTTDINWQEGHPSVGLMQVIRGTFDAYAGPFRGVGPFLYGVSTNPLANVYAALNYAAHNRGFGTGPGQVGSMHGYAVGGRIPEDVLGIGASGESYLFHGGEQVTPGGEAALVDTGLERHLEVIAGLLASAPGDIGAALGDVLNGLGRAAMRNRSYPAAGVYG